MMARPTVINRRILVVALPAACADDEAYFVCLVFSASPHLDVRPAPLTRAVTLDLEHALMMMM